MREPEVKPPSLEGRVEDLELKVLQLSDTVEQMKDHLERQEDVLVHLKRQIEGLDHDNVEFRAKLRSRLG